MRNIEFVEYDGGYPNLCRGTLTLRIDGDNRIFDHCLSSGGSIRDFTGDYVASDGPWELNEEQFKGFTEDELYYITKLVNDNVPHGCCGGCI